MFACHVKLMVGLRGLLEGPAFIKAEWNLQIKTLCCPTNQIRGEVRWNVCRSTINSVVILPSEYSSSLPFLADGLLLLLEETGVVVWSMEAVALPCTPVDC